MAEAPTGLATALANRDPLQREPGPGAVVTPSERAERRSPSGSFNAAKLAADSHSTR